MLYVLRRDPPGMSQIKELRALTGVRGVAAVYVVLYHYLYLGEPTTFPARFRDHGYLAVDLFFVLSGFVMALNYTSLFDDGFSLVSFRIFLGRRIARVYPLYLVCTVCALLLILRGWLGFEHSRLPVWPSFVLNLFMVQAWGLTNSLDVPSWSISAEWAAYLLFPLLLRVGYKSSGTKAVLAAASSLFVLVALCLIHIYFIGSPQRDLEFSNMKFAGPVVRCLAEFTLGITAARLFALHRQRLARCPRYWTDACTLAILVLLGFQHTDLFLVMLLPGLIIGLASTSSITGRILSSPLCHHLGILSYSIYLVHDLLWNVIRWVHELANSRGLPHGQTYGIVACMVLTYVISVLAYHLLERPARQGVRFLFDHGAARKPPPEHEAASAQT